MAVKIEPWGETLRDYVKITGSDGASVVLQIADWYELVRPVQHYAWDTARHTPDETTFEDIFGRERG